MADGTTREVAAATLNTSDLYTKYVGPTRSIAQSISARSTGAVCHTAKLANCDEQGFSALRHGPGPLPSRLHDEMSFDNALQNVLYRWLLQTKSCLRAGINSTGRKLGIPSGLIWQCDAFRGSSPTPWVAGQAISLEKAWSELVASLKLEC